MQTDKLKNSLILSIIALIIMSSVPLWIAFQYPAFLNDDSYITLTYAKNIANGQGFVFNHPPATQGTTTPLFTLLVGGAANILSFASLPTLAVFVTAFCWIGIIWIIFLFRQAWDISAYQAVAIGFVMIASGFVSFLGMEAYLFSFLLVMSLSLFQNRNYFWAGLGTGFLFLTRGEGVLVLFVLLLCNVIFFWLYKKITQSEILQSSFHLILGFSIPVSLWFTYAYFTFGSLLPNTLAAKNAQGQSGIWSSLLQRLIYEWMPAWGSRFQITTIPFLNGWWLLIIIGLGVAIFQNRKWLLFLVWMISYIMGYTILQVAAYWWYQLPILFVLHIFFALGLVKIVEWMMAYITRPKIGIGLSACFVVYVLFLLSKPMQNYTNYRGDSRGTSYVALSDWFNENTQPTESIAYIEIGYLGFYTSNRIIDLAGLVTPAITPHISDGDFAWGFWHYTPDYYVYLPDFDWALAEIHTNPKFDLWYQPIAELPGPRETDFIIYERVNSN
ncbi:MAG: hypothetical protein DWQ04_16980 [Chloroflexi bacterium]|nr:MAG: hypothetical protein DWQ04_16980 [Chloroflexota bacterium]